MMLMMIFMLTTTKTLKTITVNMITTKTATSKTTSANITETETLIIVYLFPPLNIYIFNFYHTQIKKRKK